MLRLVVVEGPDGSGKSTLAAKLSHALAWPVHHTGGPPKTREDLEQKFLTVEHALSRMSCGLILDRHPAISEPIYRAATGEVCLMTPELMLNRLQSLSPVVIYCRLGRITDMWQAIDRNSKPHKPPQHLERVMQQYKAIVDDYDQFFANPDIGFPVLRYNWHLQPFRHLLEGIRLCVV